ncbi:MAG: response regulator [Desulfobulbaceae bacterium]|nr:response regulator [Desulfobulbaceae bacterium]
MNTDTASLPKKATLLYVDDEPINLSIFEITFGEEFKIRLANCGQTALEIMSTVPDVACILTDQRMPGMSGIELLTEVRQLYPQTTRMIVSAWADSETLMEAVNLGQIDRFVTKPWHPDELRQIIRRSVEKYLLQQDKNGLLNQLVESNSMLTRKTTQLKEANHALKTMLEQGTALKEELGKNMAATIHERIFPLLNNLAATPLDNRQRGYIELITQGLEELTEPFSRHLNSTHYNLTSIQKQIAGMIRSGCTTKEISQLLGISIRTVETHRYRIRNKLGINDRTTCLQDALSSIFS